MYFVSFHLHTFIHLKNLKTNNLHCTSCKHNSFKIKTYGVLCKYTKRNQITAPLLIGCVKVKHKATLCGLAVTGCDWKRGTSKGNGDYYSNINNLTKGSPTWEDDIVIAGHGIIGILWNLTLYFCANKFSQLAYTGVVLRAVQNPWSISPK